MTQQPEFNDPAYQQWLYEQYLRSQPTRIQDTPTRVREPMPPYRSVEYTPPEPTREPSHRRYKKLVRHRYPDWRMVLGWVCVGGAAMASFNLLLHGIKTVCPAPTAKTGTQAVITPPKPKPKPSPRVIQPQEMPIIKVPSLPPPPKLLGVNVNGKTKWVSTDTPYGKRLLAMYYRYAPTNLVNYIPGAK